jgi:hypothetical protein
MAITRYFSVRDFRKHPFRILRIMDKNEQSFFLNDDRGRVWAKVVRVYDDGTVVEDQD